MPRWASRILLEIDEIKVERVQDITEDDAMADGIKTTCPCCGGCDQHRLDFQKLWDSIYSKQGLEWDANPFVWVVKFHRI
jgi:hypothetical protein